MKEESIWIINRFGEKLEAVFRKPDGDGPFSTVLFVSGFGADYHEDNNNFDEIASRLVNEGYATLQFSFAGRGKSEGNYDDMTQLRQADQVADIISWLHANKFVEKTRIGILALSFGVATTLASKISSIKSLVLLSGVYFPQQTIQKMFVLKGEYLPDGISWRKQSDGSIARVGAKFWTELNNFNTKLACGKIICPVYLLHGDHDSKITVQEVQQAYKWFPSDKKQMKVYSNGDHGIDEVPRPTREEFLSDVVAWFKETL